MYRFFVPHMLIFMVESVVLFHLLPISVVLNGFFFLNDFSGTVFSASAIFVEFCPQFS